MTAVHRRRDFALAPWVVLAAIACWVLAPRSEAHAQHEGDIELYSSAAGGGALATSFDFGDPIPVFPSVCIGGTCLYSSTDPGFISGEDVLPDLYPLAAATVVRMRIVAIDSGASVKIGTAVLDEPGEEAELGMAPSLHRHPSWQMQASDGQASTVEIVFRLTTPSAQYTQSDLLTARLTNADASTTTTTSSTTTSSTSTTSTTASSTTVTSTSVTSSTLTVTTTLPTSGRCGDANDDGAVSATDALVVLRVAVGIDTCAACVCDVDASGGATAVSAADALRVLRAAVGEPEAALLCSPCT